MLDCWQRGCVPFRHPNNCGYTCGLSGAQVALEGSQLMRKHAQSGKDRLDQTHRGSSSGAVRTLVTGSFPSLPDPQSWMSRSARSHKGMCIFVFDWISLQLCRDRCKLAENQKSWKRFLFLAMSVNHLPGNARTLSSRKYESL